MSSTAVKELDAYIAQQSSLDTLRFITCGSVDDGKSTLMGRMLYEAQMIFDDQFASVQKDSKTMGTQGADVDLALLVDGLSAEREQGITIDVAYRFFHTDKRKFILADTPGHEQYTRNMVTGASTADVAIILIDARLGILQQTRRHSFICSLLGIRHVVIAINKMDLVGYSEDVYRSIEKAYLDFAKDLSFESITAIPVSALKGDNVVTQSRAMDWYKGEALLTYLEQVEVRQSLRGHPMRFPVQWVNRPHPDFRGYSGTIEAGHVHIGQEVVILPSGATAKIKDITLFGASLPKAEAGQAVTITLDREVDVSRGDVIVQANAPCEITTQLRAKLVWMHQNEGFIGRQYLLKIGTVTVNAQITAIHHKYNISSFEELSATKMELNDISEVTVSLDFPIAFEPYAQCRAMGGFILIDKVENHTLAAGMIEHAMRRSQNIHYYKHTVDKKARCAMNGHAAKVLWFTGLSGSGKSTIADALEKALHAQGIRTYLLDGDNVRHGLNKDLGFTEAARIENIRRVAEVAKLMVDSGLVVLTAFISPFRAEREMARSLFEKDEFIEIFVDVPLEIAEQRDPKGLYKKARSGQIPNFTGIGSPYEEPESAEYHVHTDRETVDDFVRRLLGSIDFRKF